MTVLERRLRDACKAGAKSATVSAARIPLPADIHMDVKWVEPGESPPVGVRVVPGNECAGVPIKDDASRRQAEWALCRSLSKFHQGPTDALINRHFSQRITRWLSRTSIRPNHVTLVAGVVGLAASASLLFGRGWLGTWAAIALGGVLMQIQSVLDSCDGELARLTWRFSRLGQWLDNIADDVLDSVFIAGLGWAADGWWFWLGLAGGILRASTQVLQYWEISKVGWEFNNFRWWFETGKEIDALYDPISPLTWLRSLGRRDVYVIVWCILLALDQPAIAAGYGTAVAASSFGMMALHVVIMTARRATLR